MSPRKGHRPSRSKARRRIGWAVALTALILVLAAAVSLGGSGSLEAYAARAPAQATRDALRSALAAPDTKPAVLAFYRSRDYRPLWVERGHLRPEASQLAAMVSEAAPLEDKSALSSALSAAADGRPAGLAQAELVLSKTLTAYVAASTRTSTGETLAFVDPTLSGGPQAPSAVLARAAAAASLSDYLSQLGQANPIYRSLRRGLADYREHWSHLPDVRIPPGPALVFGQRGARVAALRARLGIRGADLFDEGLELAVRRFQSAHGLGATGQVDSATVDALNAGPAHYERLIEANLERARLLPVPGRRFILVNVAAGKLWLYEAGQIKDSMRVVVGSPAEQTPMMAGVVRTAVFNPYWNVPVDMVRDAIAPKVLKGGPAYFRAADLEALSDWAPGAVELDPSSIDWKGVAAGRIELRVRQRPGGDNMMGRVKFMFPNELGIYLHDTPDPAVFTRETRLLSAGCVRVERAADLASWLIGDGAEAASLGPDQNLQLAEPTPVYITYLTAAPAGEGVAFYPDVYGRDAAARAARSGGATPSLQTRASV